MSLPVWTRSSLTGVVGLAFIIASSSIATPAQADEPDPTPAASARASASVSGEEGASTDGDVTLSTPATPEIGISTTGEADATKSVDGALVQTGIAPSTDVVTRATDDGVQMIAILGDSTAPATVDFDVDLPKDATLVAQDDGSISGGTCQG